MAVKNLIVCGDSFNALSGNEKYKGTHWSEHLSSKLGLNLINLASVGCSNRMVVMQIQEAMKYNESLIIIAPAANTERIEILTDRSKFLKSDISLKSFFRNPDTGQTPHAFIRSVNASVFDQDNSVPSKIKKVLLSTTPFGLYKHIDKWALYYALDQLKKKQKNFLYIETVFLPLYQLLSHEELVELIGEEHIIPREKFRFQFYVNKLVDKNFDDPGYHTTPICQEISANLLHEIINEKSCLTK